MVPRWMPRLLFGAVVVALLGALVSVACPGQPRYRWPDRFHLVRLADSAGIDRRATLAIAWEETAASLDPRLRGHHCWYVTHRYVDTVRVTVRHHEPDCEVGRFQIKPSTARRRCPGLNVFTYRGNTRCFARMFAADTRAAGRLAAILRHNGTGERAEAYRARVLTTVTWLAVAHP